MINLFILIEFFKEVKCCKSILCVILSVLREKNQIKSNLSKQRAGIHLITMYIDFQYIRPLTMSY